MKKLLLSAIAAVSFFSAVNAGPGCSKCAITQESSCTPKPICTKYKTIRETACPVKQCTRDCYWSCPAEFKEEGFEEGASINDDASVNLKSSKRLK